MRDYGWQEWFLGVIEEGIRQGKTDEQIMFGIIEMRREQCLELLRRVRAEKEAAA